jgi:hypothetical protein
MCQKTYREVRAQFSEKDLVDLTMAIVAINAWNRLAISFRTVPGSYKPKGKLGRVAAPSSRA